PGDQSETQCKRRTILVKVPMIVREQPVDIPVVDQMEEGEFENAEIIVLDKGASAGNIHLGPRQQALRRSDDSDQQISQQCDRQAPGLPGLPETVRSRKHSLYG